VGTVEISVAEGDVTLVGCDKLYLVISTDETFDATDNMILMEHVGANYTAQYDFNDGEYLSFVTYESHCGVQLPDDDITLSDFCYRNEGTWGYYYDPSDEEQLLFALEHTPVGGNPNAIEAEILLDLTVDLGDPTGIEMYEYTDPINDIGHYTLGRSWNVNLTSGTIGGTGVNVRFYFDPADTVALYNAAKAYKDAGNRSMTPLKWFKTVGVAYDPVNLTNAGYDGDTIELTNYAYGTENGVSYVEFHNITSFSGGSGGFEIGPDTPLPVELLSFTARNEGGKVRLDWSTATEKNTEKFIIERSSDTEKWSSIGEISARGFSDSKVDYDFYDQSPAFATNYYRLRIIDFDGYEEYSPIRTVFFDMEQPEIEVYPNPARDMFSVIAPYRNPRFELYNSVGAYETVYPVYEDGKYQFDVSRLSRGIYILKVDTESGDFNMKVVVE